MERNLHAIKTIRTNLPINCKMANSQTPLNKLLTLVLLSFVFISHFALVLADLAPKEDDDEAPTDLKKSDDVPTTPEPSKGINTGFIHAFIASFSVIIVSEIGDKTFFIAAIMSMVSESRTTFRPLSH